MWYVKKYPHKIIFYLNHSKIFSIGFGKMPLWGREIVSGFYKSSELIKIFNSVKYKKSREKLKILKYVKLINLYFWVGEK